MVEEKAPPQKYSRYRSVRQAVKPEPEPQPVLSASNPNNDGSHMNSLARYRRATVPANADQIAGLPTPPVPSLPALPRAQQTAKLSETRNLERRVTEPVRNTQAEELFSNGGRSGLQRRETEDERRKRKFREREDQNRRVEREKEEQRRLRQQQKDDEGRLYREEEEAAERVLAEQKRKDLERLEAELDAASPVTRPLTSPMREKLPFFSRKRDAPRPRAPTTSSSGSGSNSMSKTRSNGDGPPRPVEATRSTEMLRGIEQGGGGIVPQTDAPISASNAGERWVNVRCKQSSIALPVTPETTPVELIYASANVMSHHIIPSNTILLEAYTQLGLERRLRRYEHIRDVMNSWDRDTQNALLLTRSDSPKFDTDLEASSVPQEAPGDLTFPLYHSQGRGKWNRRLVYILSSGQMFTSKKEAAKISDKDSLTICHLSDFDIYTPTPQKIRKELKPPKRYCYAVKSQQKLTLFLSNENFVHFFCSDDQAIAESFYDAVQRWRSWYLVNKTGEGQNPSTLGSSAPLVNTDRFAARSPRSNEGECDSEEENKPRQIPFFLRNSISLSPMPNETRRHPPPPLAYKLSPEAEDEFAYSGLLGRSYSQRVKQQKEKELAAQNSGPFIEGSLLQGPSTLLQRTNSIKSIKASGRRPNTAGAANGAGGDGQRAAGTKAAGPPKPLLDFKATFKEAPQWDKANRGHGVAPVQGVPLVEIATTPEVLPGAILIPGNTTVFRRDGRPATSSGAGAGPGGGGPFVKGGLISGR
ncbi:uncharacterized protein L3040_002728 [Drepanopeziza brunnea f. sp. 'multigermtubi']|uniref:PH domain-containing protein n=1 Tax=Marssonina brunnea f. sp. multigermtubi (strain MB_m1) TaxID=1072389 RepID=K1WXP4_MARBU|nr:uncharacterized protein MBM_08496 [Drepanopeziza brunnea f. sp. 'multigermtubi' MB_m1]EKD13413.1 hypothetical protein MBM_08496 [Drepanopeziza brunnea f. sp. 'multigermtubi' MB_m1]KAJ5050860.1 hypothetical protein L3040_002728 [Drepanopeziza brunnea f. sp. 'multigermtubi']